MNTKFQAVEHFSFMKKIYSKVKGSGFEDIDLCGVMFHEKYAYTTNNHIIGRITINDNLPLTTPVFWLYTEEENQNINEFNAEKFLLNIGKYTKSQSVLAELMKNNFPMKINYFFNRYTENCFFFNRIELIDFIVNQYDSQAKRAKIVMNISTDYDNILIHCKPIKKSISVKESLISLKMFCSPIYQTKIRTEKNSMCSINAFYVYEILTNSLNCYDIVGIKFRTDANCPVILFGQDKNNNKPEIFWAIAQTSCQN
ncbi:MAG: hypothetical protein N2749_00895 [Clostridia bacterium]|nr:hypothetical protein [Clostridia bacterium]